jgi:DNA polymerase III, epsilon subunit and related 3''-5'' exonucleases
MSKKDLEKYKFFGPEDAKEILSHVEGGQGVIGHNVHFDRSVLFRQFNLVGASSLADSKKWPPFFDTQETARRLGYKTK